MVQQDWTDFALQRPRYFPGQYLLEEDFALAHQYLHDRQRYLCSKLHLAGIVEGLEVEAIAGQAEVMITSGTAIDGEGNLIVLSETLRRSIPSAGWLCLRYHEEAKLPQQPEIPDSFTRFVETPLLTLEAIETRDDRTVILARVLSEGGEVQVDQTVRCYSGVRLPTAADEEVGLQSQGGVLAIGGSLTLSGQLQLSDRSSLSAVTQNIDLTQDRTTAVPSEKAVKEHIEKQLGKQLAHLNLTGAEDADSGSTDDAPASLDSWQVEETAIGTGTTLLKLAAVQADGAFPRLAIDRDSGNVGIGTLSPTRTLDVNGSLRARHIESTNRMRYRMYPADPIVYQDIFVARDEGVIQKHNNPSGYDETTHIKGKEWWDRPLICFGQKTQDDSGALIIVPSGYDTVWLRVSAEGWHNFKAQFIDKEKENLGYWTAGRRSANCYCPNGSLTDGHSNRHQWLPIPVGRSGKLLLTHCLWDKAEAGLWLGGLGFSRNPWAHATQGGRGYYQAVNGGKPTIWEPTEKKTGLGSENWNGDIYTHIPPKTNLELMVPYVWSGRDKLLYMVEHNSDWNGCMHTGITVNDQPIERFLATYDNPFARHWNSKSYNRYIAACIPADLIPKPTAETPPLLKVKINLSKQNAGFYFREMGTHDLEIPEPV
ncbi:MAG: hypothetical protein VKK04_27285 [Synechococcales bacterium]|nr:hypothetical protein [Synechococcales bacterium]